MSCTVVKYADNDDRDVHEVWNVASHDEESSKVRWSSVFQRLRTVCNRYRKRGNWSEAQNALLDLYGPSKKSTVIRWVRAAKSIDEDVINTLKASP